MTDGLAEELREVAPPVRPGAPRRDVRARKPGILHGPWEQVRKFLRVAVLAGLDALGVFGAIWTALEVKVFFLVGSDIGGSFQQAQGAASLAVLVTLLLFARSQLYADRARRPGFATVVSSLVQVTLVILVYALAEGEEYASYYIFWGTLTFALIYVSALRWAFEYVSGMILRAAGYRRRAVLVGTGAQVEAVAHALSDQHSGVDPVGFVSLTPQPANGLRDFGPLDDLEQHFDDIDEVLLTDPSFPQDQAVALVERCHRHGVRVRVAPSTMEILMGRIEFVPGQTLPLFEVKPPVFEGVDFLLKRSFDLVVSALLVLFLSPLLVLIALAVKLTSRGPVLYRSMRPGIGGAPFGCLKFRTMEADADTRQAELEDRNELGGALFKIRDDPRITRVGRLLRRFSLDELPQLFNVLRKDMSLVGPRPLPENEHDRIKGRHRRRVDLMPGLTGLWQVHGRSDIPFEGMVDLDYLYVTNWSLWVDLKVLIRTFAVVARGRGAY